MRTFEIQSNVIQHPTARNSFMVTVKVAFGGSDSAGTSFTVGPFPNDVESLGYLDNLCEVFHFMAALPYYQFSENGYESVEGFANWFAEEREDIAQWYKDFTYNTSLDIWPWDPMYERDGSFDNYEVSYYDENGLRHEVVVKENY